MILVCIIIILGITGCSTRAEYVLFDKSFAMKKLNQNKELNIAPMVKTQVNHVKFEYKIRPHDRISIDVYKHQELGTNNTGRGLSQGLLVNADGNIRLPLINDVHVAGLSQSEAQVKLESMYGEYLKTPNIRLEVLNKRAFVLGEVNNPGPIELRNERMPLLQLLAVAGDLTKGADRQSIVIMRNSGDSTQIKIANLTDANSIKTANQMIQPNDIVYVTPKGTTIFNNKVEEISPIFRLISNALMPFVSLKVLTQ